MRRVNEKDVHDADMSNWLIINSFLKIVHLKMVIIAFVKNVEIRKLRKTKEKKNWKNGNSVDAITAAKEKCVDVVGLLHEKITVEVIKV